MKSAPTSCGFDPAQFRALREQLREGTVRAVLHRKTARVLYLTPEELEQFDPSEYTDIPLRPTPEDNGP